MKKFNFRHFINCLFFYALLVIIVLIALTILGNTILRTIFSGIFGEENAIPVTVLFMRISWYIIVFFIIYLRKRKNETAKREFLKQWNSELPYNLKSDCTTQLQNGDFWSECVAMSVVALFSILINRSVLFVFIIPLFFIFNLAIELQLHHCWIKRKKEF